MSLIVQYKDSNGWWKRSNHLDGEYDSITEILLEASDCDMYDQEDYRIIERNVVVE